MDLLTLQGLLEASPGARLLVVGDVMVDRFVYGEVSRVSPEAPIPVLARRGESVMLGAAGNVARNVAALGARAILVGAVGDDGAGRQAKALLAAEPGVEDRLCVSPEGQTTTKTRFVSAGQQLLRVDEEIVRDARGEVEGALLSAIARSAPDCAAILLSDYGKGVVTAAVVRACLESARRAQIPLIVDSKARDLARYGAADVIKPNAAELAHATGLATGADTEVERAIARAFQLCDCRALLVTRADKGVSFALRGEAVRHLRRPPPEVFDTAGAGDTALAALGVAIACGRPLAEASAFALLAASVAVQKAGTATVGPEELVDLERTVPSGQGASKVASEPQAQAELARWRARGLRIGFTNGCFDILHPGHVACLHQARGWCDKLIVAVNSDRSVRAQKGPGRPVNDLASRAQVLAALGCVDLVLAFDEDTPLRLINALRPDLLVKGADYAASEVVGAELVESWGGEVRLASLVEGHSTSATLARVSRTA